MKRNPMTLQGAEQLRIELKRLKSEDRPNVIKAIAEARSHGDLSENAEYHAAREQQGFIEGRIGEIEAKLSTADIIDVTSLSPGGKVVFGATVELEAEEDGKRVTYTIVGEDEADLKKARIACPDRQGAGRRCGRGRAGRNPQLRDRGGSLRLAGRAAEAEASVRDDDAGQVLARPVQHGDVPDARDHHAVGAARQFSQGSVAVLPVLSRQADLDQFVVVQGAGGLCDHPVSDPGVSHQDHGFEGVGEATQISALFFGRFHGEILNLSGPCMAVRTPLNVAQSRTLRIPPGPIRQAFSALAG